MIAVDTNVLVRVFVEDDPDQAAAARKLLAKAEEAQHGVYLPMGVILEALWVLSFRYGFSRSDQIRMLSQLLQTPTIVLEQHQRIQKAVDLALASTKPDLSDLLIGLSAEEAGCETTYTFDKAAMKHPLFSKVPRV